MIYIVVILIVWCVFFSKSQTVGKYLYALNNWIEAHLAKLRTDQVWVNDETFVYLTNNTQKPHMLLLHGFSADKNIWLKFAKHAQKDFNLIIPDCMGHGDIPYDKEQNYSAFEQAKYISKLLNALPIEGELTIAGNSMGGMIAAILAENHQQDAQYSLGKLTLKQLVLIDPAGAKTEFASTLHEQNHNPFTHLSLQEVYDFYKLSMHKMPFMPPAVMAYVAQHHYLDKNEQYAHMFKDFFNIDEFFDEPLNHVGCKTVLIWGEKDQLLPVTDSQKWQALVSCEAHLIPNIGHMPMLETPEKTYSIIYC